jgi:hypothetical protein
MLQRVMEASHFRLFNASSAAGTPASSRHTVVAPWYGTGLVATAHAPSLNACVHKLLRRALPVGQPPSGYGPVATVGSGGAGILRPLSARALTTALAEEARSVLHAVWDAALAAPAASAPSAAAPAGSRTAELCVQPLPFLVQPVPPPLRGSWHVLNVGAPINSQDASGLPPAAGRAAARGDPQPSSVQAITRVYGAAAFPVAILARLRAAVAAQLPPQSALSTVGAFTAVTAVATESVTVSPRPALYVAASGGAVFVLRA